MDRAEYERYCAEITAQTDLLREAVRGADMRAPVPTCPGWNLGQLLRHLGWSQRWAEEVVRTRAAGPVAEDRLNDVSGYADEDGAFLDGWLAEGAAALSAALRGAGPDAPVWNPSDDLSLRTRFWARREACETAVHRADACLAVGAEYRLGAQAARGALDEWMENGAHPEAYAAGPGWPALLGAGRSVLLWASDDDAAWFADLSGAAPAWSRTAREAAVTAHGPLTGLVLFVYRRPAPGVEVTGDEGLLDLWLARTGFWLQ
ncbi:maleylpyruvate isomerase N-terminal domain-containing protein [Nocardiopsis potens]|uniref:maleylpyruvate isomerase N-terminal domain-containing protein n=1 Tax=Nocardiopsis potens TaxID=1246458 RepID=UPI0003485FFA|nr:maleylpyruvate isomerase N-terminal domain-containing protein [Nocardiopsis potens]